MRKDKHRGSRSETGNGQPRPATSGERPRAVRSEPRRASPRQPADHLWLYGIHPVLAAVANPRRRCLKLLITSETEASIGLRLGGLGRAHPAGLPASKIVSRETIDRLLPRGAVHQGIALQVEGLDGPDIEDICRATEGQANTRIVVLDQVTDPHNVGAVLRSAAAFGAASVVVPDRHSPGPTGVLAKAASGAIEKVPLVRVVNLARALDRLKQAGFWCVGLDASALTPVNEADLSGKIALVLGAEGEGLRRLTREHCDLMVRIPVAPGMNNLNVSIAAAVALYDLARRA
ncbi:MAG: 23S rRNA (guanosine(2251)-2'-O)-methyltransferase RlmB [Pseudomonadota bacterium]